LGNNCPRIYDHWEDRVRLRHKEQYLGEEARKNTGGGSDPRPLVLRFPRLFASGVGLVLVLLLWLGAEGVAALLLRQRLPAIAPWDHEYSTPFVQLDPLLGFSAMPNVEVEAARVRGDEVAFRARYRTDSYGRRVTPGPAKAPYHAIFMGDSFTFGEGVADGETLPAQFAQHMPQFKPYNYGIGGHSVQNMYLHLMRPEFPDEIGEDSGILVYTLLQFHLARTLGAMRDTVAWADQLPYLTEEADGFVWRGTFAEGRPWTQRFYRLVSKSRLLAYAQIDLPIVWRRAHYDRLARLIVASKEAYLVHFPEGRFYVLVWPTSQGGTQFQDSLTRAGVEVLYFPELFPDFEEAPEKYRFADGHPRALAHQQVGRRLAEQLSEAHAAPEFTQEAVSP